MKIMGVGTYIFEFIKNWDEELIRMDGGECSEFVSEVIEVRRAM